MLLITGLFSINSLSANRRNPAFSAFGFDEADLDYYYKLFMDVLKRNPTRVELYDLAQSNSEHSRHWFFKGRYFLNEQPLAGSLMDMVIATNGEDTNQNNMIKFSDNSRLVT